MRDVTGARGGGSWERWQSLQCNLPGALRSGKEEGKKTGSGEGGWLGLDRERFYLLLRLIELILVSSAAGEPLQSSHTSGSSWLPSRAAEATDAKANLSCVGAAKVFRLC